MIYEASKSIDELRSYFTTLSSIHEMPEPIRSNQELYDLILMLLFGAENSLVSYMSSLNPCKHLR